MRFAVPAEAGTHFAAIPHAVWWTPAFAGVAGRGMQFSKSALIGLGVALGGCVSQPAPFNPGCILPDQQQMVIAELFFARSIPRRAPLSEAEWREFAAEIVTPNFPDGFTAYDAEGQWRNPATGAVAREPTKVLLVAAPPGPDLAPRLSAVIEAYKARFRQQSIGIITRESCAAF
jgi:hypothetical protein